MKKIISFILVLTMLVSACAMAAGKEITIGNVILGDGAGNVIDFSGIELKFAAAENNGSAGVSVAAAAAGEEITRVVLSADEAGAYLSADGISSVYSISMDAIAELAAVYTEQAAAGLEDAAVQAEETGALIVGAVEKLTAIVTESMTDAGVQEVSGKEYQVYDVYVSAEQVKEIWAVIDEILALYPQIMASTGYGSLTEMMEAEGVEITYDGQVLYGEDGVMEDLYMNVDGEAIANIFVSVEEVYYEDRDLDGLDIYVALYDPSIEDLDASELGYALATVYTDPTSGEFVMFDISLGAEEEGIYAALNLDSDGEAFKYFTVSTLDNATEFYVFWGEDEDGFNVIVELADVNEEIELQAAYIMPDDGKGSIGITASDGVDEFVIAADITVADTDGAWLPEIGETVDILTIDEAQVNALTMEAIGVLGKLMSACSAVSEDFAALMAEMM